MTWAQTETQKRVYAILSADATLSAQVNGIYDHVPQEDVDYPFVVIADDVWTDRSSHTTNGWDGDLKIHVWYRGKGRKVLHEIMETIDGLIHCQDIAAVGWKTVELRHNQTLTFVEEDGVTLHGVLDYNYLTVKI